MFYQTQELVRLEAGALAPYTLVVIDCQPGFAAAREDWLQKAVADRVREAANVGAVVVLVEMSPGMNQPTYGCILDQYLRANTRTRFSKYQADASTAIQELCLAGGFPVERFEVCGVNTELCVYSTVSGLLKKFPAATVEVTTAACNCEGQYNPWDGFVSGLRNAGTLARCTLTRGSSPKNGGAWRVS